MKAIIVIFVVGLKYTSRGDDDHWTYEDQSAWPGTCRTGRQQSPINIDRTKAVTDIKSLHIRGPLKFEFYDETMLYPENNGHTVQFTIDPQWAQERFPMIWGGPLKANYSFLQLHFHWLSEHAIDGEKYDLEVHLVHVKSGLTLEEAVLVPDGLAVIGTMCKVAYSSKVTRPTFAMEQIMERIPELYKQTDQLYPSLIDLSRLISPKTQQYYTYHGSLTTPICAEVVTWIVMDEPIIIADTQIKEIHKIDVGTPDNFRKIQPTNRVVYRSTASVFNPNLLVLITTALSWLSSSLKKGLCAAINNKKMFFGNDLSERDDCLKVSVDF